MVSRGFLSTNSRFKIMLVECKKKIMEKKLLSFSSELKLLPTDIISVISFADVNGNKEAIAKRGLNSLNRNLLLLDMLRRTT